MTKSELRNKTELVVNETKTALQTVYDSLNHGRKKQIVKDEKVKMLFERYGVEVEE